MLRKVHHLSVVFLAVVFGAMCIGPLTAAPSSEGLLVSPQLLERVGLEMDWQVNLPLKDAEKISRMYVFGDYVYVLTNRNYVFCIDKKKQAVRFGLQLAVRGLPICEPSYYDEQLWFMVGNELLILDPKAGMIVKKKRLKVVGRSVVCGMARNKDYLYVPAADKRLHVLKVDGFWQMFMIAAEDGSQISSVVADDDFIVFATEDGNVTRIKSTEPKRRWQYDVVGRITAPLARDGDWIYISGRNAKLYKLDIDRGRAGWDDWFHASVPLKESVVVGEDVVYQPAGEKGVYAIDKETGKAVWQLTKGVDLLVEIGSKAYVYAEPGVLVAMDNETGESLYSVNFAGVAKYAVNTTDESLYVADLKGRVMCIKEKSK